MTDPSPDPRCPECGAPVHLNSASCGDCGAQRGEAGWYRSEAYDGLDLPGEDDDFDYEDFVRREFGSGGRSDRAALPGFLRSMSPKERFWWAAAAATLLAFALLVLAGR